ncbi:MAG: winged helix DNA-binding protein [Haliea sp.]|uniref:winged helix DNA-binding protein n=1 Tax=Haliea sp. TaxID=1932666 RepID=UPI0032EEF685
MPKSKTPGSPGLPKRSRGPESAAPDLAIVGNAEHGGLTLDRRWHLAETPHEVAVSELEYAIMRCNEAFTRWQAECLAAVSGIDVGGGDNALLHVIRMKERAKGVKEIARLMNRDDIPNIQYSLRKLLKAGLIEKSAQSSHRQGVTYRVTDKGYEITERYAGLRRSLLLDFTGTVHEFVPQMTDAARTLDLMSGIYEQAARIAATHRIDQPD